MFELVIVWESGETQTYSYETREEAERAGEGMVMALGEQVQWYGVRRKYN